MARQLSGFIGPEVSPSSLQLSLEDSRLRKSVQQWSMAISGQCRPNAKTVGVAITINKRLERIDWYGHARLLRRLWPGLLRAAILKALLERTPKPAKPLRLDEERFRDLLARLEKAKPSQRRPSTQTLDERWQFATCRVSRTTYLKTKTAAHTSVRF